MDRLEDHLGVEEKSMALRMNGTAMQELARVGAVARVQLGELPVPRIRFSIVVRPRLATHL